VLVEGYVQNQVADARHGGACLYSQLLQKWKEKKFNFQDSLDKGSGETLSQKTKFKKGAGKWEYDSSSPQSL
jgi:hypothetical protein